MRARVAFVVGFLAAAVAQAQPLIRLTEDWRSARYLIDQYSSESDVPQPWFEDGYLSISADYRDGGGRLLANSTQTTERTENELRCSAESEAACEGHPAYRRIETESRWIFRFETLEPCVIRSRGNVYDAASMVVRRGFGSTWRTIYTTNDPKEACACIEAVLVARAGESFELDIRTFGRAVVDQPLALADGSANVRIEFSPLTSSWTQWPVPQAGNGHWYRVVHTGVGTDWEDAALFAALRGGRLCAINSAAENAFVFGLVDDPRYWNLNDQYANGPWLGGVQALDGAEPAGEWSWVTLEPFVFTNWAAGEPSNSGDGERFLNYFCQSPCVRGPTWNDHDSVAGHFAWGDEFRPNSFVVEFDGLPCPDSNGDGHVDLSDLAFVLSHFGGTADEPFSDGDLNGDSMTDVVDLALLLGQFGTSCP